MDNQNEKIGVYLRKLIEDKFGNTRQFCIAYIELDGVEEMSDDVIQNMCNKMSQLLKGNNSVQIRDLPLFCELLGVTCEEILSGGEIKHNPNKRVTNYSISFTGSESEIEEYIQNREDNLFCNTDEFGKTAVDYALENGNYSFMKYLTDKGYMWFVGENVDRYCYQDFGMGTSITRRELPRDSYYSTDNKPQRLVQYRKDLIYMAIENDDTEMLEKMHARDVYYLFNFTENKHSTITCRGGYYSQEALDKVYYDETLIELLSKSHNEKIFDYFTEQYSVEMTGPTKCFLIYPFISRLIERLVQNNNEYAEYVIRKAINHNNMIYEDRIRFWKKQIKAVSDYKYDLDKLEMLRIYKTEDPDTYNKIVGLANESIMNCYKTHGEYDGSAENNNSIFFVLNSNDYRYTNLISCDIKSATESTQVLIDELNESFSKHMEIESAISKIAEKNCTMQTI